MSDECRQERPETLTLQSAADLVKQWAVSIRPVGESSLDVETSPETLPAAVAALWKARWGYLSAITALDNGSPAPAETAQAGAAPAAPRDDSLSVLYHFCRGPSVLTFRVKLPRARPFVPTLSRIVPPALLFEREVAETFGITIEGIPDRSRTFIADDWPEGIYPMRKDFSPQSALPPAPKSIAEPAAAPESKPGTFIVPIGPQHPALKEPGHFELTVDGELVTNARIRLGYVLRGIEKGAEDRTWIQTLYLMERICGICSHIHATAYVLGVEKLAGVTVPPRAQTVRTLFAELERIHSHLLWLGVAAHEAGFDTLFMYSWRDRETVMDLLERLSGNRVNYSVNVVGGVKYDVDAAGMDAIRRGLDHLEGRSHHYLKIATTDESFLRRTRGVGTITREQADMLGIVGPTARASGVPRDVRHDSPYAAYPQFPVEVVLDEGNDLVARFVVRIKELFECYRLIRAMLDRFPTGDLSIPVPRRIPEGEVVSRVEGPRGELFYYIRSAGGPKPDRVKVRTPSLCNWAAVESVAVGHKLADIPMILVGIDPCFSCNDRSIVVRRRASTESAEIPRHTEHWSWEDLRRHGIRSYEGGAT